MQIYVTHNQKGIEIRLSGILLYQFFLAFYSSFLFSITWFIGILSKMTWSNDSIFISIELKSNCIERDCQQIP